MAVGVSRVNSKLIKIIIHILHRKREDHRPRPLTFPVIVHSGSTIRPVGEYFYSHGCQDGSILHKLSWLFAAATSVLTLLSVPSKLAKEFSLATIAVTARVTIVIRSSPFMSVGA